jgi:hypothetical protein
MKSRHILLLLLLTGLLVLIPACSSDDDDNGGTAPPIPTYDDPVLEAMATEGAEVAQGIIDMAPGWMAGQVGKRDTTAPVWDAECMCWRWTISEGEYTDPMDTWSRVWALALTYYQGETPQQDFEGADRIGVVTVFNSNASSNSEAGSKYAWFTFTLETFIEPGGPGLIMISGSGAGNLGAESYAGEDYTYFNDELTIVVNLTMPLTGGCPTGALELDTDTKSFSVGFNGGSTAYWDYVFGPGQFKEGEMKISCGK